jgi:hypothetical protein
MRSSALDAISAVILEQAQAAVKTVGPTSPSTGTIGTVGTSSAEQSDSSQFSPLGQLIATLQQLQTDPAKYAQVTQQIATNLQADAQTAQTQGDSSEAQQLNALAADFSGASKSGNVSTLLKDLTPASGTGHYPGGYGVASTTGSTTYPTPTAASASNQLLSLQAAESILNTLNASRITTS